MENSVEVSELATGVASTRTKTEVKPSITPEQINRNREVSRSAFLNPDFLPYIFTKQLEKENERQKVIQA